MKKDVKISIVGLHQNGTTDSLEVISFGEMYEEDGQTIVKYEEALDNSAGKDCEMVQSQLKLRENQVEILKEGGTQTHMVFVKDQDMLTYYTTPFGELEIVIHTDHLEQKKLDNGFHVELGYALEVNAAHVSDCNVRIKVEEME